MDNLNLVDEKIIGRVDPQIYAFSTETIPNYLKIGDTYRPLLVRLNEWRKHFPDLEQKFCSKAIVKENVYFRDYSIHDYLIGIGKDRLALTEMSCFPNATHYSKEFFKDTSVQDIQDAIEDIKEAYKTNSGNYQFYDAATTLPETHEYSSTGWWDPRPNQDEAIKNFVKAVDSGRHNLLMYAVMRFGKSFTSLCCAKTKNYRKVLVVSAKADVKEEWKKTVQSADNFNKDYVFLCADDLMKSKTVLTDTLKSKGFVLFLTLQDLQGDVIKEKHSEVFSNVFDMLIVDETHYGARADSYGKIIAQAEYIKDIKSNFDGDSDDFIETEVAEKLIKKLNVGIKLHLSGTPYRILMGSEFEKEDIISFCQFTDIVNEQKKWNEDKLQTDGFEEWDNPYFGFPEMIRFAFTPSNKAEALLNKLRNSGYTYALSKLLEPESKKKAKDDSHKKFIYKKEVLELFKAIDGSVHDENVFSFLNYDKIKKGKMCRHIVCVLPYRASCDALEELIKENASVFLNLSKYEIINISGVNAKTKYKTVEIIKDKIKKLEESDKKTITLTVNRMLTGSTVEQWDTMIFLKDTASPQEYDQAIFRLQNQYVKTIVCGNKTVKYNMKPQTLLVDFDPNRMFIMQEQKSKIYNVNVDVSGNSNLRKRIEAELEISPIITVNRNKLKQVEPEDILAVISNYSSERGVREEANGIPVDFRLFDNEKVKKEIDRQNELGNKGGLTISLYGEGDDDFDEPDIEGGQVGTREEDDNATENKSPQKQETTDIKEFERKFKTYYSRLLFYSFLTEDTVKSLSDIIDSANKKDNVRIMRNLGISIEFLRLLNNIMNPFITSSLDYSIENLNKLSRDTNVIPDINRAITAIGQFGRISDSEITTNIDTAESMIDSIPDSCFIEWGKNDHRVLDLASKMGEFAIAISKKMNNLGFELDCYKSRLVSIPTSSIAYEFTRKVYKFLGLDLSCIATMFNSYDLLKLEDNKVDCEKLSALLKQQCDFDKLRIDVIEGENNMFFDAIVGNPPYQEDDGGAGASARPIYPHFVKIAKALSPNYISIIIPSRWYTGGKHLGDFRKDMLADKNIRELHDCLHPEEIFPDTNNRGGICYVLWDMSYDNTINLPTVFTHDSNGKVYKVNRPLKTRNWDIFIRDSKSLSILDKVIPEKGEFDSVMNHISPRKPFALDGDFVDSEEYHASDTNLQNPIKCYGKKQAVGYIESRLITTHREWIDKWKVFMPYANNIGTELNDDNQNSFIGAPGTVCTETFIMVGMDIKLNEKKAENLSAYLQTKFARYLLSLAKTSQHGTSKTYCFVPMPKKLSVKWTDKKLYKLYELDEKEIKHIEDSIKSMEKD